MSHRGGLVTVSPGSEIEPFLPHRAPVGLRQLVQQIPRV
jgi:hypothetical protein